MSRMGIEKGVYRVLVGDAKEVFYSKAKANMRK